MRRTLIVSLYPLSSAELTSCSVTDQAHPADNANPAEQGNADAAGQTGTDAANAQAADSQATDAQAAPAEPAPEDREFFYLRYERF